MKKVVLQAVQRPPHRNHITLQILLHQHINYHQNDRIAHITHIQEKTNEKEVDVTKRTKGDIDVKKREVREDIITTIANYC
jgi:hypothetical protein